MSIESKALFLRSLEDILSREVPARTMQQILCQVSDQLAGYDMEANAEAAPEKDDLLEAYLAAIQISGRSPKTVERYRYLITRLASAVHVPVRKITVYHLRAYLAQEKARGISDRTLDGMRQVYSAFFGWLYREQLIESNPAANLGTIKYQKKVRDVYSDIDLERLKRDCSSVRDLAIILFLMSTGCRISEMTGLNRDDVDLQSLEVLVLGKGNKERTVYLSPFAAETIRRYLAGRTDPFEALFVGKGTKRLTPAAVRKMLRTLADRAHVQHVHPHKFRRTLATNLIRHGMPIQEVASILGHDKLDTTMQYVVLDKADVKNAYRKYA